jgi:1-deoxyxylulose-5-phosphate synthase
MMHPFSRRDFIRTSLAGAGALMTAPALLGCRSTEGASTSFKGTDMVTLGKTGIKTTRLAQGTGYNGYNHSSEQTRAGKQSFDRLVRYSIDEGVRFLDMADLYGSHPFVQDVIRGLPRNKFTLLSKIWPRKESWVTPSGGAKAELDRFRKELNVEQIDIVLIHCMMNSTWPEEFARVRDELAELKQKGVVRAVGVSCHDMGALKAAAVHPWVDVILARINYRGGKDYSCDGTREEVAAVLQTAHQHGKAVVGMKVFGAGKLVKPEEKDASLDYVLKSGLVDAITVGMLNPTEVQDTLTRMAAVKRA